MSRRRNGTFGLLRHDEIDIETAKEIFSEMSDEAVEDKADWLQTTINELLHECVMECETESEQTASVYEKEIDVLRTESPKALIRLLRSEIYANSHNPNIPVLEAIIDLLETCRVPYSLTSTQPILECHRFHSDWA